MMLQTGARGARSHGPFLLARHHYIEAIRLRRRLHVLPVTLCRRPTGGAGAAAAASSARPLLLSSPYNCYVPHRDISTSAPTTTADTTTAGGTQEAVASGTTTPTQDTHVPPHPPPASGDTIAPAEATAGKSQDGAEPDPGTEPAASTGLPEQIQSTEPAPGGASIKPRSSLSSLLAPRSTRQATRELQTAQKEAKMQQHKSKKQARDNERKFKRNARRERRKVHRELMAKQDQETEEKRVAAAARIAAQKEANAAKEEEKNSQVVEEQEEKWDEQDEHQQQGQQGQQTDEHGAKLVAQSPSPLLRPADDPVRLKNLSSAFAMAKRSLRKETDNLPASMMNYKWLIKAQSAPKNAELIAAHLARVQTAMRILKSATPALKHVLPMSQPTTPMSQAEELGIALVELESRVKYVQKIAASRPQKIILEEELNKVITTTSVLRDIIRPPTREHLRKGVAKSAEEVIKAHRVELVGEISLLYPLAKISLDKLGDITASIDSDAGGTFFGGNMFRRTLPDLKKTESLKQLLSQPDSFDKQMGGFFQDDKFTTGARGRRSRSEEPKLGSGDGVGVINSHLLSLTPVETVQRPIPRLTYGLDRVLFNPGVYQLRDLRTGVYNFDPYLANLMPVTEFDYGSLTRYITSSKDPTLIDLAKAQGKKYTGSTSSMTSVLAHFHFLLSSWRNLNPGNTTRDFHPESVNFTRILRSPAAIFLHHNNGRYAVDADKEYDKATILSMLGQSMEKLFTTSKEEFERYRKCRSHEITEEEKQERNAYNYTELGDFLMRSQLDAQDDRLPGTGVFDLKTRAVISIRMDAADIGKALGYEITQRFGNWESYEREYYDLVRSAFLKYSLQVRMGRMDGIFVAYHNTQNVFGFQYFPLGDMDFAIHGTHNTNLGDREFTLSVDLLNKILDRATERFPGRSLRLHFETRPSESKPFMYIFAKPVTPEEIEKIQTANEESVAEFERNVLGIFRDDKESSGAAAEEEGGEEVSATDEGSVPAADVEEAVVDQDSGVGNENAPMPWPELRSRINEAIEKDELGVDTIRDAVEDALEESGLISTRCGPADSKLYVDTLMGLLGQSPPESAEAAELFSADDAAELHAEPVEETGDSDGVVVEDGVVDETSLAEGQQSDRDSVPNEESNTKTTAAETTSSPVEEGVASEISATEAQQSDSLPTEESNTKAAADEATFSPVEEGVACEASATEAQEPGLVSNEEDGVIEMVDKAPFSSVEAEVADKTSLTETQGTGSPAPNDEKGETPSGPADAQDSDAGVDVGKRAVDADILAASVPQEESKVATLKELLLLREKQQDLGAEHEHTLARIRELERVLSTFLTDHIGRDHRLHQLPHPSVTITPAEERVEELVGFNLVIRNRVDGIGVDRPYHLDARSKWEVEYTVTEMPDRTAQRLYMMLLQRRKKDLEQEDKHAEWYQMFQGKLHRYSTQGRQARERRFRRDFGKDVCVYGEETPRQWHEAFESSHIEEQMRIMKPLATSDGEMVDETEGEDEVVEGPQVVEQELGEVDEYVVDEDGELEMKMEQMPQPVVEMEEEVDQEKDEIMQEEKKVTSEENQLEVEVDGNEEGGEKEKAQEGENEKAQEGEKVEEKQ